MPQVTVYEVAANAGVSIATVSRVLNAPEKVNEATRARVLATIDRLGFVPKAEAAARARKDHGRIGVLAPFFTFPSFVARFRGVANALSDSPYDLAILRRAAHQHFGGRQQIEQQGAQSFARKRIGMRAHAATQARLRRARLAGLGPQDEAFVSG